jgi:hypothetical protein
MIRGANKWLWPVVQHQRQFAMVRPRHIFLAICDHFEPMHHTDHEGATQRLLRWRDDYIAMAAQYRDSSGRGPRHSFFYPIEQYDAGHLDLVTQICRTTGSEIEVQLHHDHDTEETLAAKIQQGIADFRAHGSMCVDAQDRTRFGFVHGNWALCNSRPDGRWCGVPTEIKLLRELGCYADFTFPSAPSETQPRRVNQIGYATECGSALALDQLEAATAGVTTQHRHELNKLLLVQGPLALNWARRKWGLLPRLENADLTQANPATAQRLGLWMQQQIHVRGREDWHFIKLHSHGATPANAQMLLGAAMHAFHEHFTRVLPEKTGTQVHYVTAREMVNLIHAAEDGSAEPVETCFDYHFKLPAAV